MTSMTQFTITLTFLIFNKRPKIKIPIIRITNFTIEGMYFTLGNINFNHKIEHSKLIKAIPYRNLPAKKFQKKKNYQNKKDLKKGTVRLKKQEKKKICRKNKF